MSAYDVIVIGQGYAGLTAAKLCVQKGLRTANFEAEMFGGLIVNVNELDPGPGGEHASGVDVASNLAMENMEAGVEAVSEPVNAVARGANGAWTVTTDGGSYSAPQVIVATGARFRALGIAGETELVGRGVSHCADCDGPMYGGKEAVIVGGGDSAFQEALALAQYCSKVTMVYRGAAPRARADLVARVAAAGKIVQLSNARPLAILGSDGVDGLQIECAGAVQTIACAGVFIFAGLEPNTACVPGEAARDATGALVVSERCATSLPGLWAIGAVRAGFGGTLDDAAADAATVVAGL